MAAVVPSASSSRVAALAALVTVAGCTQPAPPLPQDYTSVSSTATLDASRFEDVDLALTCAQIADARQTEQRRVEQAEAIILADRGQNQAAGYFGALFLLPLVAVDTNDEQVALVKASKARVDELRLLGQFRDCA